MARGFDLGGKKPLPPEFAGALDVGGKPPEPDAELFHVQVLGFGRCRHDGAPFVIQALNRAAECTECGRRYVFAQLQLETGAEGTSLNVTLETLPADADHPIRRPLTN